MFGFKAVIWITLALLVASVLGLLVMIATTHATKTIWTIVYLTATMISDLCGWALMQLSFFVLITLFATGCVMTKLFGKYPPCSVNVCGTDGTCKVCLIVREAWDTRGKRFKYIFYILAFLLFSY